MLPPRIAVRCARGVAQKAVEKPVEEGARQAARQRQRQQRRARLGAHRRHVAEIDGERAVPDGVGRHERAIEVDALDQRVGREHLAAPARRLHDGGIVAGADVHPGGDLEAADDALDERLLAEFSDGEIGGGMWSQDVTRRPQLASELLGAVGR